MNLYLQQKIKRVGTNPSEAKIVIDLVKEKEEEI